MSQEQLTYVPPRKQSTIILRFDCSSNNKILSLGVLFNCNTEMADKHYNLLN